MHEAKVFMQRARDVRQHKIEYCVCEEAEKITQHFLSSNLFSQHKNLCITIFFKIPLAKTPNFILILHGQLLMTTEQQQRQWGIKIRYETKNE